MRILCNTLLLLFASIQLSAAGIHFQDLSLKKAMKLAAEQDKLVFIDAYTTWCMPCKMMDKEAFRDPKVGAFMNEHFVSLKFDMESAKGQALPHSGYVRSYPAYLFINPSGDLVYQSGGYMPADAFLGQVNQAIRGAERFKMKDQYSNGDRDPAFVFQYISEDKQNIRPKKMEKMIREMLDIHEDWSNPYLIGLMMYLPDHTGTEVGQFLIDEYKEVTEVTGWSTYTSNMLARMMSEVIEQKKLNKAEKPDLKLMKELFEQKISAEADRFGKYYEMIYAMDQDDLSLIADIDDVYLMKYGSESAWDYRYFSEFLYLISDDPHVLDVARIHILKAIALAPKSMDCYMILSAIYDKTGDKEKAEQAKAKGAQLGKARGIGVGK